MDESKVIKASEQGYLKFLFVRIATNSFNSVTSPFYKKYRHLDINVEIQNNHIKSHDQINDEFECNFSDLVCKIETEIDSLNEYERELFKLYVKFESYRKVSEEVGIKYESVRHAIIQASEKIKKQNEQLYHNLING